MNGQLTVGGVVDRVFGIYRDQFGVLVGTAAVIFIIAGILRGILFDAGGFFLFLLASIILFVATILYQGMVVRLVEDVQDGRRDHTVGQLLESVVPVLGSLIIASIIAGIAIGIGFILLIIPGLILLTIWAVIAPVIVVEGSGPIGAFGRSFDLVRGHFWTVLGAILVFFLIAFVVGFVLGLLGGAFGVAGAAVGNVIAQLLTAPLTALVAAVLYFRLLGTGGPAPAAGAPGAGTPPPPPPESPPPPPSSAPPQA